MKLHKYFNVESLKFKLTRHLIFLSPRSTVSIKPLIDFRGYGELRVVSGYLYTKYSGLRGGGALGARDPPPRVNPLGGTHGEPYDIKRQLNSSFLKYLLSKNSVSKTLKIFMAHTK